MKRLSRSALSLAVVAIAALSLGACAKHEEAPPIAAAPPPPPPPPPAPPPPSTDDQLQGQLAQIGATQSSDGWTITLSSAKFKAGKVAFAPDDDATLGKIDDLLKSSPNVRVLIKAYTGKHGSQSHDKEVSQLHANAVLRDLTTNGIDAGRVQAQGRGVPAPEASNATADGRRQNDRVEIVFSNAEGEFPPAPVENS